MKIALIGATGYVGASLLEEALNRGHQVTALVRHPQKLAAPPGSPRFRLTCRTAVHWQSSCAAMLW